MTNFDPSQLNRMDTQRLASYRTNLDFYNGSQWQQTSRHRQLVFNYTKVSVDKLTSFLMPGLGFACCPGEVTEELKTRACKAEQLLRQVYDQNNLQQLDYETEIDTAILGDGCYKVIWDTDEKRIRITAPDVSGIYAWWLGDDTSRLWRVASRYILTQDEVHLLYSRAIKKKQVTITEVWTAKTFDLYLDDELIKSRPNPYGFIPFIIFPNLREPKKFWGTSDIPSLIQPQRELNRALSQLSRILELSGNPIAVLENIASAEDIKVQPGALWTIPEDAKAYLLDLLQGGGVRLHVDYIELLYRALHDVSEMPRAAWGGVERELSGTALRIELDNSKGQYANPGQGNLANLKRRSEVVLKLGYKTTAGNEASEAGTYWIDSWEYSSEPNISRFSLTCLDGWGLMDRWTARYQMRWNKDEVNPKSVWQILYQLLSRAGIKLTNTPAKPQSSAINNFYPDFAVNPGTRGDSAIRKLLSFVPDKLVFSGQEAFTKNPLGSESSCYSYGSDHAILSGKYTDAVTVSRARAIGRDSSGSRILEEALDWDLLQLAVDILEQDYDPNLQTAARAQERADAILRQMSLWAERGNLVVPTNVGQELLDVITVTDERCGISEQNYRVQAIHTDYDRRQSRYEQKFTLGAP